METYIALYRGINVGKSNRLTMSDLVATLQGIGCQNVRTYIQSGNAVFESRENDTAKLSRLIRSETNKHHGFETQVLVLRPGDARKAMAKNPFPEAENDPQSLHLGFLASAPENPDLKALEKLRSGKERFRLEDKIFYLHAPEGVGRSRLAANAERLLGVSMTDRNWRTVSKLMEMAEKQK